MMRSSFIKSLLTIAAAPSLLAELNLSQKTNSERGKILASWVLLPAEIWNDQKALEFYLGNPHSALYKNAERIGINFEKDFDFYINHEDDFFVSNIIRIEISQQQAI